MMGGDAPVTPETSNVMGNTTNAIEALADDLVIDDLVAGNDDNGIEQIANEESVSLLYSGNPDNKLEALITALHD